jgi:charged multivesicular body protein 4
MGQCNVVCDALSCQLLAYDGLVFSGCRDINQVDTTMDDIREQMDLANEISEAIGNPVGFGLDMDEVSVPDVKVFLNLALTLYFPG